MATYDDYYRKIREFETLIDQGKVVTADKALILAGPPSYSDVSSCDLYPIGVVEALSIQQGVNINASKGIATPLLTWKGGAARVSTQFGRVIFSTSNLLRALYAYYPHDKIGVGIIDNDNNFQELSGEFPSIIDKPGYKDFFIDLQSDLFSKHFGLALILCDQNFDPNSSEDQSDNIYGAIYLERAIINAHNLRLTAGDGIVGESVSVVASRARPAKIIAD